LYPDLRRWQEAESSSKYEIDQLKHQLSTVQQENLSLLSSQQESFAFGIEPWKVPREAVVLESVIGGGGWGSVHKGRLQVAVKQCYPNIMSKQNLVRLKREMRMLALIRHPNLLQFIAAVFDENEDHRRRPPYIITELLDTSLRSAYEDAQLPSHSLLSIFKDTARALDYLHRRHEPIIHRDVSSANVLLKRQPNEKWIAKLSDLGSANLAREAYTMNEGARVYCAPEAFTFDANARSQGTLTPKVDVYSYGVMLCEVATSTFPDGVQFSSMLTRVRREWPQLHQLIVACTIQSPEQRPTMGSVLGSLETFPGPI
jgi:serine/threonine protein kinase